MIGTLGNKEHPFTCSYAAARHYAKRENPVLFATFEQAIECLKQKALETVIVPSAYPKLNQFIMDKKLLVSDTFMYQIPALVLAKSKKFSDVPQEISLFHHPATENLINEIDKRYVIKIRTPVSSNSEACVRLLKHQENALAITNSLCVDGFDLECVQTLRKGIKMPFLCFTYQPSEG